MTVPTPTHEAISAERLCAACGHDWSTHDAIAARYCAATSVSGEGRGCVCVPNATKG